MKWETQTRRKNTDETGKTREFYLVDIEFPTARVEVGVERLEHVDDVKRRARGADGRESHDVREEHGHVLDTLGLYLLV